jgi:transposase, IS30 family
MRHSKHASTRGQPRSQIIDAVSIRERPAEIGTSVSLHDVAEGWDRGMEMAKHKEFSVATDVQVYFCDPHSPWQRGANENTNRLLRQCFPKGTDLSIADQRDVNRIARELNRRPRKTLDFRSPAEVLNKSVALTG